MTSLESMITAHGLLRFLERVEGHDSAQWRHAAERVGQTLVTDGDLLAFAESYCGIDLKHARRRLMRPELRNAISIGARGVNIGGFRYTIGGDGAVITVRSMRMGNATKRQPDRPQQRRPERYANWRREVREALR